MLELRTIANKRERDSKYLIKNTLLCPIFGNEKKSVVSFFHYPCQIRLHVHLVSHVRTKREKAD